MRVSRNEPALALALALVVSLGVPAAAQQSPPIRLAPPQRLAPPPAAPAAPASPDATAAPAAGAPAAEPAPSGIQVAPLAPVDPEWTGTLGEDKGGFSPKLWQGTPRHVVLALTPALPVTTSPTVQGLERRLLLANALPPAGREDATGFLGGRAQKLLAMGFVDDAAALLEAAPGQSEPLEHTRIELKLLAGDQDGACRSVGDGVRRYQGLWWARALIACQAIAGQREQAALGLNLLREQKAPKDAAFDALVVAP